MTNTEKSETVVLSFIVGGRWSPAVSGDYATDNQTGHRYAIELLHAMHETENPALFGAVIRSITEVGKFSGVEVGLCSHFGIVLAGLMPIVA